MTAIMPTPFQNCTREGTLPGCLFKYDHPEEQCSEGRTGKSTVVYAVDLSTLV